MNAQILERTAKEMVAKGKGIIAADESAGTCKKRFEAVGIEPNEENRRRYRELIITSQGLEQYVSGIILFDETIRQKTGSGVPFTQVLNQKGILPGIKVDEGLEDFPSHAGEKVTKGLDGLAERLAEYRKLGARFAKWRAVINIGVGLPTDDSIAENASRMARYAKLCQEADIVPIVEPEVLIDGDHSIERCYEVTARTQKKLFEELKKQNVLMEGVVLKASMVIAGKEASKQSTPAEVGRETVRCLKENVPKELGGVVFLSGGQGDEQATENLNEMNKLGENLPWALSFSYSRAIQNPVLKIWAENPEQNVEKARAALLFRSRMNSLASEGKYSTELEKGRPY